MVPVTPSRLLWSILRQASAFACQWCVSPPICTSTFCGVTVVKQGVDNKFVRAFSSCLLGGEVSMQYLISIKRILRLSTF